MVGASENECVATIGWELFGTNEQIRSVVVAAPVALVVLVVVSLATKLAPMVNKSTDRKSVV